MYIHRIPSLNIRQIYRVLYRYVPAHLTQMFQNYPSHLYILFQTRLRVSGWIPLEGHTHPIENIIVYIYI
jgi:hypothetical protein